MRRKLAGLAAAPSAETDPSEAGFDAGRLARLDAYLEGLVASGAQKGSLVAITRGGRTVHVSQHGFADAEAGVPVEVDTIWRIFSMSKPVTSVAALMLIEEGLLSLTDPVEMYIPAFANMRVYKAGQAVAPVTVPATEQMRVWHLMTHTAGLTYGFMFNHPVDEAYRNAGFGFGAIEMSLAAACERWGQLPLLFEPGSEFNYSHATDVLGRLIEVASGMSIDRFLAERMFEPLGMADSGFAVPEAEQPRLAALYSVDPQTGQSVRAQMMPVGAEPPTFLAAGHGLVSTASDYLRFAQMLLRRGELDGVRLLAPRTVDLMRANHLPGNATMSEFGRPPGTGPVAALAGRGFGLGVAPMVDPVGVKSFTSIGEYGWPGAGGTDFWVDPAEEITVAYFTQLMPLNSDVWVNLRRFVYQALIA